MLRRVKATTSRTVSTTCNMVTSRCRYGRGAGSTGRVPAASGGVGASGAGAALDLLTTDLTVTVHLSSTALLDCLCRVACVVLGVTARPRSAPILRSLTSEERRVGQGGRRE